MPRTPDQPAADPTVAPVTTASRIDSLDVLRGLALCGILVMNIPFFAFSAFVWFDPTIMGGFEGADYAAWLGSHLFFDLKMMAIFSMLFGAGVCLFADKAIAKHGKAAGLHYTRMAWLLAIGLVHAYFIWEGDILVLYALIGMLVYPLRRLSAGWLIAIGVTLLLIAIPINAGFGWMVMVSRDAWEAQQAGDTLEPWQEGFAQAWPDMRTGFEPTPQLLEEEAAGFEGGYLDRLPGRAEASFWMQTWGLFTFGLWRIGGLFCLGMALFKLGVLSASRSARFYAGLTTAGFAIGLPIIRLGVRQMQAADFDVAQWFMFNWWYNYFGSLAVALGWIGLVMLVCVRGWWRPLRTTLAAMGRMAFTNYIAQSIICFFLFYGSGLGLWGDLSRIQLVPIVVAIWLVQAGWSIWWLRHFRFGPLEYLWRALTYRRLPTLKIQHT